MTDFNEAQSTNLYLIDQLVIARKENEVLKDEIATLIEHIKTLQEDIIMRVWRTCHERIYGRLSRCSDTVKNGVRQIP